MLNINEQIIACKITLNSNFNVKSIVDQLTCSGATVLSVEDEPDVIVAYNVQKQLLPTIIGIENFIEIDNYNGD